MLDPSLSMKQKLRLPPWMSMGIDLYFYSGLVWQARGMDPFL